MALIVRATVQQWHFCIVMFEQQVMTHQFVLEDGIKSYLQIISEGDMT